MTSTWILILVVMTTDGTTHEGALKAFSTPVDCYAASQQYADVIELTTLTPDVESASVECLSYETKEVQI